MYAKGQARPRACNCLPFQTDFRVKCHAEAQNSRSRWTGIGREDNHFFGGQAGVNLALWDLAGPLSINCELKAGNVSDKDFARLPSNGGQILGGQVLDGTTHPRNFFGATPLSERPSQPADSNNRQSLHDRFRQNIGL